VAIYHLHVKNHSRSTGVGIVAKAAYRSGSKLHDDAQSKTFDYGQKRGVVFSELILPADAPAALADRGALWNLVEATSKRKDARLAREVQVALPKEIDHQAQKQLLREFIAEQFVALGMAADFAIHESTDGNPHAHILLTDRPLLAAGFGAKNPQWNSKAMLFAWRAAWSSHCNRALELAGLDVRVDHRSYAEQGIALVPTAHLGVPVAAAFDAKHPRIAGDQRAVVADAVAEHRATVEKNTKAIIRKPDIALKAISATRSTFTERDLSAYLQPRITPGRLDEALGGCLADGSLIWLGADTTGSERYVLASTLQREREMVGFADRLAAKSTHAVAAKSVAAVSFAQERRLGFEQELALRHIVQDSGDLAVVQGYAGAGKSMMLGAAREAWQSQGYRVLGTAIAGKAAEGLQRDSGIESRTIAAWLIAWRMGHEELRAGDVLVIDEAGMVGTDTMHSLLSHADAAGAKVVLVGDTQQLQAIEAGAAMKAVADRVGEVAISEVRRQRHDWMRAASRAMGRGETREGLEAYRAHGAFARHETQGAAIAAVLDAWQQTRREHPAASQLLLAYTRKDVAALNELARERLKAEGLLKDGKRFAAVNGEREFAVGDQLLFLKNDRKLAVKNGTLARVEAMSGARLTVGILSQDGALERTVEVDLRTYNHVDHGYAVTIHKSQGATVDHVHVLASEYFDQHVAYVALSRHRESVTLHWSEEEFRDEGRVLRCLSRASPRLNALDFARAHDVEPDPKTLRERIARALPGGAARLARADHEAEQRLAALNDAELEDLRDRLAPVAARRLTPASDLGADYPGVALLHQRVEERHRVFDQAAKGWDDYREGNADNAGLLRSATKGRGAGAPLHRAFKAAFAQREKAIADLQTLRREIQSSASARKRAQKDRRATRAAHLELARIDKVMRRRQLDVIHTKLEKLEPARAGALRAWADLQSTSPALVRAAYRGAGEGGPVFTAWRDLDREVGALRIELAAVTGRKDRVAPAIVGPRTLENLTERAATAETRALEAATAWAHFLTTASPDQARAAREDRTGTVLGASLYLDCSRSALEHRALVRALVEARREAKMDDKLHTLEAAEKRLFEHPQAASEPFGRAAVATHAVLRLDAQLARTEGRALPPVPNVDKLIAERPLAEALGELELRHRSAFVAWRDHCQANPNAWALARQRHGEGAPLYEEWRNAVRDHQALTAHVLSLDLSHAESTLLRIAESSDGNREDLRGLDRDLGRLQWDLDRTLATVRPAARQAPAEGVTPQDWLADVDHRFRTTAGRWEAFKSGATPEAILDARRGTGPGASMLSDFRAARLERQHALGAVNELSREPRIAELAAELANAETKRHGLEAELRHHRSEDLAAAEKAADRDVGSLTWKLDHEIGIPHPTPSPATAAGDLSVRWEAAHAHLAQASATWEAFKANAEPAAILEARRGTGPAAAILADFNRARAERNQVRIDYARAAELKRATPVLLDIARAEDAEQKAMATRYVLALGGTAPPAEDTAAREQARTAQRQRVRLESALAKDLGFELPAVPPPHVVLSREDLVALGSKLRATHEAWVRFRDASPPEHVLDARRGRGPGAQAHLRLREARTAAVEFLAVLELDRQRQRGKQGPTR